MSFQSPAEQTEGAVSLVARLRAEASAQKDKSAQALLLHECAVLEESEGDEPVAARDYLAAFNADPQFREPLESLVRILSRRKSVKNLGKLLEALCRAASTPDERGRAFWERAAFILGTEGDLPAVKELLDEAVAENPDDPTLWLELELCAAKAGDVAGRIRALEARAEIASDPTWKAFLLIELSDLAAESGDSARAYELLGTAAALEGQARFRTQLAFERIALKEENLAALAHALEGQVDLIEEAIEDGARGDATGVPRYLRKRACAADVWLRVAEVKRRLGDAEAATGMIEHAFRLLPESSTIARMRLAAFEASGDTAGAAALAERELERGATGPFAAALWNRLATARLAAQDRDGALAAVQNALQFDRASLLSRCLELDLLADGKDAVGLASAIEAMADALPSNAAKVRAYLLAAFVWGRDARDAKAAKSALTLAASVGVQPVVKARFARLLASITEDAVWYEQATHDLLAHVDEVERSNLLLELGRMKLRRGEIRGAESAFAELSAAADGFGATAWLGRVLMAYAVPAAAEDRSERAPGILAALAEVETDPATARGLWIVTSLILLRSGDEVGARERLRELHRAAPSDLVVAVFLAQLEGKAGDNLAAAAVLSAAASEGEDADLSGALHLEAALLMWRSSSSTDHEMRARCVAELEAAARHAPRAAGSMLYWALRGALPDSPDARRRALDVAGEWFGPSAAIALERFALEAILGESSDALSALESVEADGTEDLAAAAALARILFPPAIEHGPAVNQALDLLESRGGTAAAIALGERFSRVRTIDQDKALAASRARAWYAADPKLYSALEWTAAALAAGDREGEIAGRRAVAVELASGGGVAVEASAAILASLDQPTLVQPLVQSEEPVAQLVNLELAQLGCDPRRRAAALHGLGAALGDSAQVDALALAGWSELAMGEPEEARNSFSAVIERHPEDLASWEGIRSASAALGDHVQEALACAQLGALCRDPARGAEFWEKAGLILLEHTDAKDDAEISFDRAFERDPSRATAFDKLFRAVRGRNEDDRLLAIISRRLLVAEDDREIGKLYWERARVLRKKGDIDGALTALENVTMLEPDHVGALALLGEVYITKGAFAEAAPALASLARSAEAPAKQRLMSGVAAVDLYEKKLGQLDKALEVLLGLHQAGLSTVAVRERLASVAARAGSWGEATTILEQLMNERDKREGRIEAARLGMAIWRDKLGVPVRAQAAVSKLLDEAPDDAEAVEFVIATNFDQAVKLRQLGRAKQTVVSALARNPVDAGRVELLAKLASFYQDQGLRQAALSALIALGRNDTAIQDELHALDARVASRPQMVLDAAALEAIADPQDGGPIASLFEILAETITLVLGPSLVSLGVTKKDRISATGAHPLRVAIAEWMGAIGVPGDFDLYVGGPKPEGVFAIAGEQPALVLGSAVSAPFGPAIRSAVAREVFALRRGLNALRTRDDNTIASLVAAATIEAGLNVQPPPYSVFAEVARAVKKELPRKVRKAIPEVCQRIQQSGQDAREWAATARRSIDRMAVIAAGDVSIVLSDMLEVPRTRLGSVVPESERARRLLTFVLSPNYLELRKSLGMGVR